MEKREYLQSPDKHWTYKEVCHFECTHCGKVKLSKYFIDTKGESFIRDIVVHEIAVEEWLNIYPELREKLEDSHIQKDLTVYGETKQDKDGNYTHTSKFLQTDKKRDIEYKGAGRIFEPETIHTIRVGV
jgi:hypothetical protein